MSICAVAYLAHFIAHESLATTPFVGRFTHGVFELVNRMWWGILAGILALTLLSRVPREFVASALGRRGGFRGAVRAGVAGLMLDLCNHGILMVGAKLYERGATLGQTFAFLIASPWNSLSTTLILIALIGWQWTLAIVVLSAVVAVVTGTIVDGLVGRGVVAANPNRPDIPASFRFWPEASARVRRVRFSWRGTLAALRTGISESRMILRWIFFGAVLAAAIRGFVPTDVFRDWFGATVGGLLLTLVAATVIEVCSEGSSPIAADLFNRAAAPGNGFAFLMAGAATDYTEVLVLRETTASWKLTLLLPVVTVPQILALGWMLNIPW